MATLTHFLQYWRLAFRTQTGGGSSGKIVELVAIGHRYVIKPAIIISLLLGFVLVAHARSGRGPSIGHLFYMAPLAVTGEVTSITPLGIETTLSYPTVHGVTFHWLRVTCKVRAILK